MNSAKQDMPKITGWFNWGISWNPKATGVVSGANYTKRMATCEDIIVDLSETLTCKSVAHH